MTKLQAFKARIRKRILRNVEKDPVSGCWIWALRQNGAGYGRMNIRVPGRGIVTMRAHRLAYIAFKRRPPAGLEVAHSIKCVAPLCVNPKHLRATTRSENEKDKKRARLWWSRELGAHVLQSPKAFRL